MSDKEEIRSILLDLLQVGLLRIRVWGWNEKAEECADEADRLLVALYCLGGILCIGYSL